MPTSYEVAHIDPFTLRELQQLCIRCEKRKRCALDLADEFAEPGWQYWRNYCPDAATLSTFQSCSEVYK
jgi:hypothetical protein